MFLDRLFTLLVSYMLPNYRTRLAISTYFDILFVVFAADFILVHNSWHMKTWTFAYDIKLSQSQLGMDAARWLTSDFSTIRKNRDKYAMRVDENTTTLNNMYGSIICVCARAMQNSASEVSVNFVGFLNAFCFS
jgi:hypothetical protein